MLAAFEMAGFAGAHAIVSVSTGGPLIPMLSFSTADGQKTLRRLAAPTLEAGVAQGKKMIADNEMNAKHAVLLYDGRLVLEGKKMDAILVEIIDFEAPGTTATLALPYSPKTNIFNKFRVHRPKILAVQNCDDLDVQAAMENFFEGVNSHEDGGKLWNSALDESR